MADPTNIWLILGPAAATTTVSIAALTAQYKANSRALRENTRAARTQRQQARRETAYLELLDYLEGIRLAAASLKGMLDSEELQVWLQSGFRPDWQDVIAPLLEAVTVKLDPSILAFASDRVINDLDQLRKASRTIFLTVTLAP